MYKFNSIKLLVRSVVTAIVMCVSLFTTPIYASANSQRFSDMPPDVWCYDVVAEMADAGLIDGYPDETFRHNNNITRAEVVALLSKFDFPALYADRAMSDVPESHWAHGAVSSSIKSGLAEPLVGQSNLFRPEACLTRNKAVTMASVLHGLSDGFNSVSLDQFTDGGIIVDDISRAAWKNLSPFGRTFCKP